MTGRDRPGPGCGGRPRSPPGPPPHRSAGCGGSAPTRPLPRPWPPAGSPTRGPGDLRLDRPAPRRRSRRRRPDPAGRRGRRRGLADLARLAEEMRRRLAEPDDEEMTGSRTGSSGSRPPSAAPGGSTATSRPAAPKPSRPSWTPWEESRARRHPDPAATPPRCAGRGLPAADRQRLPARPGRTAHPDPAPHQPRRTRPPEPGPAGTACRPDRPYSAPAHSGQPGAADSPSGPPATPRRRLRRHHRPDRHRPRRPRPPRPACRQTTGAPDGDTWTAIHRHLILANAVGCCPDPAARLDPADRDPRRARRYDQPPARSRHSTETIPAHLRRAVILRDRHCGAPGCYQPPSGCHVHHTTPRSKGGRTKLTDLILLCAFHHLIVVHTWGWTITLNPDGTTTMGSPGGTGSTTATAHPPQPPNRQHRSANSR